MFQQINSFTELINLPDGTLLRWRSGDRESVAYLLCREHERGGDQGGGTTVTLSLSPGPEWDSFNPADVLVYPVDVILLGHRLTAPNFDTVDVSDALSKSPVIEDLKAALIEFDGGWEIGAESDKTTAIKLAEAAEAVVAVEDELSCRGAGLSEMVKAMGSIPPNDGRWPGGENPLITDFGTQELISGGTYPRDVALQAAALAYSKHTTESSGGIASDVLTVAQRFVDWLSNDAQDSETEDTGAPGNSEQPEPAVMSAESAAEAMTLDLALVTENIGLSTGQVSRIARSLAALGWKR